MLVIVMRLGCRHAYAAIKAGRELREHSPGAEAEHLASLTEEDVKEWLENKLKMSNRCARVLSVEFP